MRFAVTILALVLISAHAKLVVGSSVTSSSAASATDLGYLSVDASTTNSSFSFGEHYAVLNLDLINALVSSVNGTTAGDAFISNVATWINAVHQQTPPPLSIFTRIYFSNTYRPEISPEDPYYQVINPLGNVTEDSFETQLNPLFSPLPQDVVLRKSRYYAGDGNSLEEILRSQKIDTVILVCLSLVLSIGIYIQICDTALISLQSGIRTSGVVLSTAYHLLDLNYNV
jgi:hypothetical protein